MPRSLASLRSRVAAGAMVVIALVLLLVGAVRLASRFAPTADAVHDPAFRIRETLSYARVNGYRRVVALVAAESGAVERAAAAVTARGGTVVARYDDVDYFRAVVPLALAERLADVPGIEAYELDPGSIFGTLPASSPRRAASRSSGPRTGAAKERAPAAPAASLASLPELPAAWSATPHSPLRADGILRAPELQAVMPKSDGRGVTVAVMEGDGGSTTIDFSVPVFQGVHPDAATRVPSIVGHLDASARLAFPTRYDRDVLWLADSTWPGRPHRWDGPPACVGADGLIGPDSARYHAPRAGCFAGGVALVRDTPVAAAWNEAGAVWLDANGNRDFRDDRPLVAIDSAAAAGQPVPFALLPADSTTRPARRPVTVTVAFNGDTTPWLYAGTAWHQTMTAASVLGMAPGARVLVAQSHRTNAYSLEVLLLAERDPRVDLVSISQLGRHARGTVPTLFRLVLARAVARYGKPIFLGANNAGPASMAISFDYFANYAGVPGVALVGAYASRENAETLRGGAFPSEAVLPYSTRGPGPDGTMVPAFVAPTATLTAAPCAERVVRVRQFRLPRCAAIGGGTSNATPTAAGAAARLIGAAKQAGIPYDAPRLLWALQAGARFIDGADAPAQGNGLIQLDAAWRALWRVREVRTWPLVTSRGPVRASWVDGVTYPAEGPGIFEREGWAPGDTGTRVITIERTDGPRRPQPYLLRWVGTGSQAFHLSDTTIQLARGMPVSLRVRIAPRTAGLHGALLAVLDPSLGAAGRDSAERSPLPVLWIPITVVVAPALQVANGFTHVDRVAAPWPIFSTHTVSVPSRSTALRLTYEDAAATGERLTALATPPVRAASVDELASLPGLFAIQSDGAAYTALVPAPPPGVWELPPAATFRFVEPPDPSEASGWGRDSRYRLTAAAYDVGGTGTWRDSTVQLQWSNQGAALASAVTHIAVGARRRLRPTLTVDTSTVTIDITVDSGTTRLQLDVTAGTPDASVGAPAIDLFLYECSRRPCTQAVATSTGRAVVRHPAPGRWVAVVASAHPVRVAMPLTFDEITVHPRYGRVLVADPGASAHAAGARWRVGAVVPRAARGAVPAGYSRVVLAEVIDAALERAVDQRPLDQLRAPGPVPLGTLTIPIPDPENR